MLLGRPGTPTGSSYAQDLTRRDVRLYEPLIHTFDLEFDFEFDVDLEFEFEFDLEFDLNWN